MLLKDVESHTSVDYVTKMAKIRKFVVVDGRHLANSALEKNHLMNLICWSRLRLCMLTLNWTKN